MRRTNRKFGIELEFGCDWETLDKKAKKIINKIYGRNNYYSQNDKYHTDFDIDKWHIKEENIDVSELTTPVSRMRDMKKIKQVIDELKNVGIKANEECGFHVHIDIPDIDRYHIVAAWMIYERAIVSCFPLDRRKCVHCAKIIDEENKSKSKVCTYLKEKAESVIHGDIISLQDYDERKTIEFRLAEGTNDSEFIECWVDFLLYWIQKVKDINPSLVSCERCNSMTFYKMIEELGLRKKTERFMDKRYDKYGKLPYWIVD